jgi:hypothetical protein
MNRHQNGNRKGDTDMNRHQKLGPAKMQRRFSPRTYLLVVLAMILTVMLAGRRIDATRAAACIMNPVVTTNADSGAGSLRDAIANACSGSTITFANTVVSPIVLQTELAIDANLTIQGPGAGLLTISGNNAVRVFHIGSVTPAISVSISGLTISDGKESIQGAGILSVANGTVNISEVTVSNNTVNGRLLGDGAGINNNAGTMNITDSTISGNVAASGTANNGGGIENDAAMNITGCTISGNSAPFNGNGAGVANLGGLTITNSTISGNTAGGQARGGGIFNSNTLTAINCTISGNSASGGSGGGGLDSLNNALLINDTIVGNLGDNGGGVYQAAGTVTVQNTIIALNSTNGLGPDTYSVDGFTSQGFNLIGKGDGASGFTNGTNNDQVGSIASPLNPKLQLDGMGNPLLQNNGGPTETIRLLAGSPAINAGDDSVLSPPLSLTTDQRGAGFPRKLGAHVDIGAVAFSPCAIIDARVTGSVFACQGGGPSNITVTLSGGAPPYTVTLNNSGGTMTGQSPLVFTVNPLMTTTYSVASATDSDSEDCPVTGEGSATVTVGSSALVTLNPVSQTITGGSVTFTAAASGTPTPTVQWQVSINGGVSFTNIAGATSTSLTFTPTPSQSADKYRAVFTNQCSTATTTAATLTIFDQCLKDNSNGDLFQFNSRTGQYLFTVCSTGFTLSGTGVITNESGILTLTDSKSDRKISAGVNSGQHTGTATIYLLVGQGVWQTYRINATNPSAVCACGGAA